jgi:hypothetical protein
MIRRMAIAVVIAGATLPAAVHAATLQGEQTMKRWAISDKCAQQAQRRFPDYTAEAQAKRNQAYEQCLDSQNLPPRDLPAPGQQ